MPEIKNSREIVWFQYKDGTEGAWCKSTDRYGNAHGHYARTDWRPNSKHPNPLEFTKILEMADYIPAISKQLEQLMLLYNLNKEE